MKNNVTMAVISVMSLLLSACSPQEVTQRFVNTNYASITLEGSNCYGVINLLTNQEIIPQRYTSITYHPDGYFLVKDSLGFQLFDRNGQLVIPLQERIENKGKYFEFQSFPKKGFYFIRTQTTISGEYTALEIDQAENILFLKNGKGGILNQYGQVIIPGEYTYLIYDGINYNVAKNKTDKHPIVGKDGKANWNLAEAYVFDRNGNQLKKLTASQAKKIFERK